MKILPILLISLSLAAPSLAGQQKKSVRPDGTITFQAATGGVTRIALSGGDRIKEMVADNSNFEPKSNPETGDVFLRYVGGQRASSEDGFIVTEKGHTFNYSLRPKNSTSETVLINLKAPTPAPSPEPLEGAGGAFATTTGSSSGGHVPAVTGIIRQAILAHIDGRTASKRESGTVIARVRDGGLTAKVMVVAAGKNGGSVQPQSLYRPRVVGVFVDKINLGPYGRTFVVIVEQKS